MSDLAIRPFEPSDLPAMQEVRRAAFAPVFASFRSLLGDAIYDVALARADEEQAELLASMCQPGSSHSVFVAELDGALVGFVGLSFDRPKRVGEIGLNAVHPDHAGRGAGTRMYEFALERMRDEGMLVATVGTGGDPGHAPARRAYEKAGFGPALPSVWMYRLL